MAQDDHSAVSTQFVTVQKLVAADIVCQGYRLILAKFSFVTALGVSHTGFSRGHAVAPSPVILVLGANFLCLALDNVPLPLHVIHISHCKSAHEELAAELVDGGTDARRYTVCHLLLLVPLIILVLAGTQDLQRLRRPHISFTSCFG